MDSANARNEALPMPFTPELSLQVDGYDFLVEPTTTPHTQQLRLDPQQHHDCSLFDPILHVTGQFLRDIR